jgi:ABC-type amino acid transport substrate-binding protein
MPIIKAFSYRLLVICLLISGMAQAQPALKADSWQDVLRNKKGTITALWYDIEPFIYTNKDGQLEGVEYEIMESLKPWLFNKYGIELNIEWVNAGSFENIYEQVKQSKQHGVFGWSYYSITPQRKKEVHFTPPYMPDMNVLITNNSEPVYATSQELTTRLNDMRAYTMANTTMADDIETIRNNFYKKLRVIEREDDYVVMKDIAEDGKGFGYVPLSVYIVGLQKGIHRRRRGDRGLGGHPAARHDRRRRFVARGHVLGIRLQRHRAHARVDEPRRMGRIVDESTDRDARPALGVGLEDRIRAAGGERQPEVHRGTEPIEPSRLAFGLVPRQAGEHRHLAVHQRDLNLVGRSSGQPRELGDQPRRTVAIAIVQPDHDDVPALLGRVHPQTT